MQELATIGVYGFSSESFLEALREANVKLLFDVRQRRGVRGSEYAWANAKRLEAALVEAGVVYQHLPELAPTTEMRQLQYRADDAAGVGKRSRVELDDGYIEEYTRDILDPADLGPIVRFMPADATTALLCVERDAEACHRSLVAQRIGTEFGLPIRHLRPNPNG